MYSVLRSYTATLLIILLSGANLMTGCKSSRKASPSTAQNEPAPTQTPQLPVDDLVAPIALYPDQLLAQVLSASMNPQEVLDGGNWILQNQGLKGEALTNAAKAAGFSPSMQYLMLFPQVVDNMCQEMPWTTQLGQAFQSDQAGVMAAVQRRRAQAQQAGNLASSPQMKIDTKIENGQQYVEIKPADPKVVYVPQYNPVTIYNVQTAPAPAAAPVTTAAPATAPAPSSGVSAGTAAGIGLLSFGVGMMVGAAVAHNNTYYPYPAWGHGVYYGGHPYYPPPYRPAYPGYHPAGGYYPPANYQWNQANKNVNVNVNNNYYNQFNKQNVNSVNTRPASTPNANAYNRPAQGANTYQGARPATTNQKPGASMTNAVPGSQQMGNRTNQTAGAGTANRGGAAPAAQSANQTGGGGGSGNANAGVNPARSPTGNAGASRSQPSANVQTQDRSAGGASAPGGANTQANSSAGSGDRSGTGAKAAPSSKTRKPR
jgi:Protein of unknown function (DUF3300)